MKYFDIILIDCTGQEHVFKDVPSRLSDMAAQSAIRQHKDAGGKRIISWSSRPKREIKPEVTYPERLV